MSDKIVSLEELKLYKQESDKVLNKLNNDVKNRIDTEEANRVADVDDEEARAKAAERALSLDLAQEAETARAAESALDSRLDTFDTAIAVDGQGNLTAKNNTTVMGDLTVKGTTTTVDQETIQAKSNLLVTNSTNAPLTDLTGVVALTGEYAEYALLEQDYKPDTYYYEYETNKYKLDDSLTFTQGRQYYVAKAEGVGLYDPVENALMLGEGKYIDGEFDFDTNQGQKIATRGALVDGQLVVWDDTNHTLVDAGDILPDDAAYNNQLATENYVKTEGGKIDTLSINGDKTKLPIDQDKNVDFAVDGTYNASTNKLATESTVSSAIAALDNTAESTTNGEYVDYITETDGIAHSHTKAFDTNFETPTDNNAPTTLAAKTYTDTKIAALNTANVGQDGSYLKTIVEVDGIITATPQGFEVSFTKGQAGNINNNNAPTTKAVQDQLEKEAFINVSNPAEINNYITSNYNGYYIRYTGQDSGQFRNNYIYKIEFTQQPQPISQEGTMTLVPFTTINVYNDLKLTANKLSSIQTNPNKTSQQANRILNYSTNNNTGFNKYDIATQPTGQSYYTTNGDVKVRAGWEHNAGNGKGSTCYEYPPSTPSNITINSNKLGTIIGLGIDGKYQSNKAEFYNDATFDGILNIAYTSHSIYFDSRTSSANLKTDLDLFVEVCQEDITTDLDLEEQHEVIGSIWVEYNSIVDETTKYVKLIDRRTSLTDTQIRANEWSNKKDAYTNLVASLDTILADTAIEDNQKKLTLIYAIGTTKEIEATDESAWYAPADWKNVLYIFGWAAFTNTSLEVLAYSGAEPPQAKRWFLTTNEEATLHGAISAETARATAAEILLDEKSGELSSEITNIKDGTAIDSFGDVENALAGKVNYTDITDTYDNTATYNVNDVVIYNNTLYKCITAITVAEDFDPLKWTAISILQLIDLAGGKIDTIDLNGTPLAIVNKNVNVNAATSIEIDGTAYSVDNTGKISLPSSEADLLSIEDEPTEDSENLVTSGGVYDALATKVDKASIIDVNFSQAVTNTYIGEYTWANTVGDVATISGSSLDYKAGDILYISYAMPNANNSYNVNERITLKAAGTTIQYLELIEANKESLLILTQDIDEIVMWNYTGLAFTTNYLKIINLTRMYGAGSEPTLAKCQEIFTQKSYNWADFPAAVKNATLVNGKLILNSFVQDILTAADMTKALEVLQEYMTLTALAPTYSINTLYIKGAIVNYNGLYYRCIQAPTQTGAFDPTKWSQIKLSNIYTDIDNLKSTRATIKDLISMSSSLIVSASDWTSLKTNHYLVITPSAWPYDYDSLQNDIIKIAIKIDGTSHSIALNRNASFEYAGLFFVTESSDLYEISTYLNSGDGKIILRCAQVM